MREPGFKALGFPWIKLCHGNICHICNRYILSVFIRIFVHSFTKVFFMKCRAVEKALISVFYKRKQRNYYVMSFSPVFRETGPYSRPLYKNSSVSNFSFIIRLT